MKRAAGRGVDIRVLVPKSSDQKFVDMACQSYFWLTLRAGIRIFRYEPEMMHAKTIAMDDVWVTVGSSNLDNISLLLNYEDNIVSTDKSLVKDIRLQFEADLKKSKELKQEEWHDRGLGTKTLELSTWPLHRLM